MHRQSPSRLEPRHSVGLRLAAGAFVLGLAGLTTTCKLQDLVRSNPLSELELTPSAVVDSAREGSTAPRVTRVALAIGSEDVPWTLRAAQRSAWLRPAATGGTAPETLAVTLDPTGLAAGVHRDTLILTPAGPAPVPVALPVEFRIAGCAVTDLAPGASVTDTLTAADCGAPHRGGRYARLYRVAVGANDSVSFRLSSPAFDPYLVVDTASAAAGVPSFAENDACRAGRQDACVRYAWRPAAGDFVVEVTTAAAGASGAFTFTAARPAAPAAPDSLAQTASDLLTPLPVGGAVSGDSVGMQARVADPDEDSVRLEVEVRPVGTAFTGTPVATGPWAASGSRAVVVAGGLTSGTSYHWQVRSVDRTGRSSGWTLFGPGTADFTVAIPHPPATPASLAQLKSDGTTAIPVGGTTNEPAMLISGVVADSDVGDVVRLEVEVRPLGTAFTNAATASSPAVARGTTATASVAGLADDVAYHWQARAVDQTGRASAWTPFGGNAESATDVRVAIAPVKLVVTTQPGTSVAGSPIAPAVQVAAQDGAGNTLASFTGTVTAALGANAAGGTLSGTLSVAAVNGVATFADLRIDRAGTGYTLTSTSGALTVTTAAFTVVPAGAGSLAFSVQPSNATAGAAIAPAIQVTAHDSLGNVATGFVDTVRLALTAGTGKAGAHLLGTTAVAAVSGVATFAAVSVDSAGTGYTLAASASGVAGATSAAFNVAAGAISPAKSVVTVSSGTVASGGTVTLTLQGRDADGNAVTTGGATVAFTASGGTSTGTVGPTTDHADGTYTAVFTGVTAGTATTIGATIGGVAVTTALPTVTVTGGTASRLFFTTEPTTVTAAAPFTVAVTARDAQGNTATGFTGNVTVAITPGTGTAGTALHGTTTVAAVAGVATFSGVHVDSAGTGYTLTATAAGVTSAVSVAFNVVATSAGRLVFSVQPANTSAGTAFGVSVTAVDSQGNTATSFTDTVRVALTTGTGTAGAHLLGTVAVAAVGGVASFTGLRVDSAGTGYTLTADAGGTIAAATSAAFAVAPGTAKALFFTTEPSGVSAGAAFAVAVTARDSLGNVATGYTGSVAVAITPGTGTSGAHLLGTTTVAAASGVASFSGISIDSAGTGYTLGASATGLSGATSTAFSVSAGSATRLSITTEPSDTVRSGVVFARQPVIQLRDASGNAVSESGVVVTAAIASGGGTLAGTTAATTDANGAASFTDLAISGTVGNRTLSFASGTLTAATSTAITVIAGPASQLTITTEPSSSVQSGVVFLQQPVIQLRDASGNAVAQSGVQVTAAIATGGGTLGGTATVTTNGSGAAGWTDLSITGSAGDRTLSFAATGLTGATSTTITVGGGTAGALAFTTEPPASTTAGVGFGVVVTAQDGSGNTATGFTGNVTVAITSGTGKAGAHLRGTATVAAVGGVATFSGLSVDSAGTGYTLTATASGVTGGVSGAFAVTPAPAQALAFTTEPPTSVAAGAGFGVAVTARDSLGNVATSFGGTVTLALGGGKAGAHLSGTTSAAAVSGVATFGGLSVDSAATGYALTASATGPTSGTSSTFAVTAGNAKTLAFTTQPVSTTAGAAFGVAVTARDSLGNTATGFTGTVGLALSGGKAGAHLSGATSVAAASGVATFSGLSVDSAGTGYRLTATSGTLPVDSSTSFSIIAAAVSATKTTVTAVPDTILATAGGSASTITVTAKDSVGNPIQGLTVTLAASGSGNTLAQPPSSTDANGVATGGFSSTSPGSHTISATVGGVVATQQPTVVVLTGTAIKVVFTTQPPTSTTAGSAFGAVATVQDSVGNTVTSYTGTVAVTLSGGTAGAHLLGTTSVSAVGGVATFSGLRVDSVGSGYYLTATSGTLRPGSSGLFSITPGVAKTLAFTTEPPSSTTAGAGFGVVVTARDSVGNTATGFTGTVSLALGGGKTGAHLSGTTGVTAVSGVATFSGLSVDSVGTGYQLTASASGPTNATSTAFAITSGTAKTLVFTTEPPASSAAGAGFGVTVTARDSLGNTATGFTSTVSLALGGGKTGAHLGGTTSVAAVSGVATFSGLSVDSAGTGYTLTASASGPTSGTSTSFAITGGAAKTLVFTAEPPSTSAAGAGFGVTVTARDSLGNTATGFSGTVSLALGGGTTGAHLSGTASVAAVSGVATFAGLSVDSVGAGYTLTASASGPSNATSTSFAVTAGAAKTLVFTTEPPASTSAGSTFGVVVTARDSVGNTATGFTGTVSLALSGGNANAHLSGTTSVTASAGVASFGGLSVDSAGTGYQLTASATGPTSGVSTSFTVTASTARTLAFTTQPPPTTTAGVGFGVAVTARDSVGNTATGFTGDVTVAITSGTGKAGAHLRGTVTVAAVAGVATFSGLSIDSAASGYTLTATSGTLTHGTSNTFTIAPAPAVTLRMTGLVAAAAGFSQVDTVTALDSLGNVATGYRGTVHFTSSDPLATLPADYSFKGGDAGKKGFTGVVLRTAGTPSVTATDKTTAAITGSQSVAISPALISATTSLVSVSSVTVPSGATDTLRLQGKDQYGNNETSGGATVVFSDSGGTSTGTISSTTDHLNGTYTAIFTAQAAGTATTIHASVNGARVTTTPPTITVTAATAKTLVFTTEPPASSAAGASFGVTVTARDSLGNTATGFTGTVSLALGGGKTGAHLGGTTSVAAVSGVATFSGLTVDSAATGYTLTASASGPTSGTSTSFAITAGTAKTLVFTTEPPASSAAGAGFGVTVTARDSLGNTATGFTSTVSLALGSGKTGAHLSGTASVAAVSGVATFSGLTVDSVGTGYTLTANATGPSSGTSSAFAITPGALDHFAISAISSPQTAGTAITGITLTAQDAFNNTDTSFAGSVTYGGTAGITGTSAAFTGGVLTGVSVTPTVAGTGMTFTVTGGGKSGSATFDVNPGALDHFAISAISSPQTAGTAITGITLTAQDASNNTVTSFVSTVTYGGTAGITGTSGSFTAGVLTGVSVTPTVAGTGMTFTVTGGGKSGSASFDVAPGPLDHFAISAISSPQIAGTAITGISLTAQDAFNNTDTSFVGSVTYGGTAGITGTSAAFTAGVLSGVSVTPTVAGTGMTFTVTGGGKTGTASFDVAPGPLDHFAISAIGSPQTAGTPITGITLTAQDAFNNTDTAYVGAVTYGGTAGITGTSAAFTGGALTGVSVTPTVAGTGMTFTVTGGGKTGSASFDVSPGPASTALTGSTVSANPTTVSIATQTATITVQLKDVYGNNLTASGGTVTVAIDGTSTGTGVLSGVTDNLDGTYTATFTPATPGTVIITATLATVALANTATITVSP